MKIFALVVLVTLFVTVLAAIVALASWPGKVAKARNHPYADAVNVAGWVSIVAGGVFWPLALIWAHATPALDEEPSGEMAETDGGAGA